MFVAVLNKEIIGEAHLIKNDDKASFLTNGISRFLFSTFRVDPTHQRKGVGTKLKNFLEETAKKLGVEELVIGAYKNDKLHNLYKRWGYSEKISDYIDDNQEAVAYLKRIK